MTIRDEIKAIQSRDPAARSALEVVLAYPGFHAIQIHRLAHRLYERKLYLPARLVSHLPDSSQESRSTPAQPIGERVFIDHGMGVVIGETASSATIARSIRESRSVEPGRSAANGIRRSNPSHCWCRRQGAGRCRHRRWRQNRRRRGRSAGRAGAHHRGWNSRAGGRLDRSKLW